MTEHELDAFLAKVRHTRLVDYLDPLGETAQNAFERRLSWARVTQHDPAYADEARFLLENAEALREVLRDELVEDDWVEDASAGSEFSGTPVARRNLLTERERVTTFFGSEDLSDDADNTNAHLRARRAALGDPDDEPTTVGEPRRAGSVSDRSLVSFDDDPDDVLTAVGPARGADEEEGEELDDGEVDPFDAPTTVGVPAVSRVAPRATPPPTPPEPTADELSEYIEIDVLEEEVAEETVPPSPTGSPAFVQFEETAQQPVVLPSQQPTGPMVDFEETADEPTGLPSRGRSPLDLKRPANPGFAGRTPAPAPARLPQVRNRPALSGRLPELRRPPTPQQSRGIAVGLAVALLGFGFLSLAGAAVVFLVLQPPDESLTIERIDEPLAVEAPELPGDELGADDGVADVEEPEPRRSAEPVAAEPEPAPVRRTPPPSRADRSAEPSPTPTTPVTPPTEPEPVAAEPDPAPAAPEPPAPEPEPVATAAVPPSEASPEVTAAGSPSADLAMLDSLEDDDGMAAAEPDSPPPAPPTPPPATPGLVPPPASTAALPPEVAPTEGAEPASPTGLDVTGLWIGAGDGRSFKLTIRSQDGPTFSGVVELKLDDGSWMQSPVTGRVDGSTIQFAEGSLSFRGNVSGKRASGTYTTQPGGPGKVWTLIR